MIDIIKNAENLANGLIGGSGFEESFKNKKRMLLQIKPLRENDRGIDQRIAFIRNLGSINGFIELRISGNHTNIKLYMSCESKYIQFIENMFYASYPESELIKIETELSNINEFISMTSKTTIREDKSYKQGDQYMSPFHDILSLYNTVDKESILTIKITLQLSKEESFFAKICKTIKKVIFNENENVGTKSETKTEVENISEIQGEVWVRVGFRIQMNDIASKQGLREQLLMSIKSFITSGKVEIKTGPSKMIPMLRSQIVNFFNIPTQQHLTKALDYAVYRKLPYPYPLPTEENTEKDKFTLIGTTDYRTDKIDFGMIEEDKFRHAYIVGKTGTGKSTFLSNLIANDIKNGKGIGLLDPHGELVETVLEHIPSYRINDVILFDVADSEYPIGFNLLQYKDPDEKIRIVSGVVTTFQKLFAHSWGPRLEYILRNVLLTIVDYPNATIMHILRILTDKEFREEVLKHVHDSLLLKFRKDEYGKRDERQKQEAIGPITNKIGQFLSSSVVRNIFGQPKSKLSLREAMDSGKIILINLSKGKIGEDNANMIGSLLVTKFQIDAMSRSDIKADERRPFYLYIDEFQNFATDSFAVILSEARKYKLSLIMANQYTSQLLDTIKDAIFGNIGSIFSFTIGYDDAKIISNQFKELVTPNDLISLPRFTAYTRMMINGVTSDPFSMKTKPLPTPEGSQEQTKKIIEQSRQRYAMEKGKLERLLDAWQKKSYSPSEKIALRAILEGKGFSTKLIESFFESQEDDRDLRYESQKPQEEENKTTVINENHINQHQPKQEQHIEIKKQDIEIKKDETFNISEVKIGKKYEGYIKLQFNYGLFITVKGVEGLLHKHEILCPEGVSWKKYFTVGDPISVIAKEFKEIDGEKKVVWSMK